MHYRHPGTATPTAQDAPKSTRVKGKHTQQVSTAVMPAAMTHLRHNCTGLLDGHQHKAPDVEWQVHTARHKGRIARQQQHHHLQKVHPWALRHKQTNTNKQPGSGVGSEPNYAAW